MLTLIPVEYWLMLAVFSTIRLVSCQLINYILYRLSHAKIGYFQLADFSSFGMFMLMGGVGHAIVVYGIMAMFYITFTYVVPVNEASSAYLHIVQAISYLVLAVEAFIAYVCVRSGIRAYQFYKQSLH